MTVEERVISIIATTLGVDREKVTLESSLMDDLGADSLDTMEVIIALEEEFEIEISDEEVMAGDTIGEAITGNKNATKQGLVVVKDIIEFIKKKIG